MPWKMSDAPAFTKKAATPPLKRAFAKTANAVLAKTGSDASAVKVANAQVKKMAGKAPAGVKPAKPVMKAGLQIGAEKRKQKIQATKPAMMNKASFA